MTRTLFRAAACAAALLFVVSACAAPPVPPTTPAPTVTALVRATLPPTWTPTPLPTVAPPTALPSPTPTRTPAPTLSAAERCTNFVVNSNVKHLRSFGRGDQIAFLVNASTPDGIRLTVRQRFSGENLNADVPGGSLVGLQLPLKRLSAYGLYDWTLTLRDGETAVCTVSGAFIYRANPFPPQAD
jgi:hypothetical protein